MQQKYTLLRTSCHFVTGTSAMHDIQSNPRLETVVENQHSTENFMMIADSEAVFILLSGNHRSIQMDEHTHNKLNLVILGSQGLADQLVKEIRVTMATIHILHKIMI